MKMDKDQKIHQKYLSDICCDISQHSEWRCKLFDNPENMKFEITPESIDDMFLSLSKKIRKYNLKYIVERVPAQDLGYPVENPLEIVFKFYPKSYSDLTHFSFNNPDSR